MPAPGMSGERPPSKERTILGRPLKGGSLQAQWALACGAVTIVRSCLLHQPRRCVYVNMLQPSRPLGDVYVNIAASESWHPPQ